MQDSFDSIAWLSFYIKKTFPSLSTAGDGRDFRMALI